METYDISGDGLINHVDLSFWLDDVAKRNGFASAYLPGDADLNGAVEFADFLALSENFGGNNRDWANGNFNGDGNVDFSDFLALSANFGTTLIANHVSAVPEPVGLYSIFGVLASALSFRKRKRPQAKRRRRRNAPATRRENCRPTSQSKSSKNTFGF